MLRCERQGACRHRKPNANCLQPPNRIPGSIMQSGSPAGSLATVGLSSSRRIGGELGPIRDAPSAATGDALRRLRSPAAPRPGDAQQPISDQFEKEVGGADQGSPAPGGIGEQHSRLGRPVLLRRSAGMDENVRGFDGGEPFDSMHASLRRVGNSSISLVPANESPVKRRLPIPAIPPKTA